MNETILQALLDRLEHSIGDRQKLCSVIKKDDETITGLQEDINELELRLQKSTEVGLSPGVSTVTAVQNLFKAGQEYDYGIRHHGQADAAKIQAIKAIRTILGVDLRDAKALIENA